MMIICLCHHMSLISDYFHLLLAGTIGTTLNGYVEMIQPCPVSRFYGITCVLFLNRIAGH